MIRKLVQKIELAPEIPEVVITYRAPEPFMKMELAGTLYLALHKILLAWHVRRLTLPMMGRRPLRHT